MSTPAVCITGWANAGKTTLIEGVLRVFSARGLRVGVIKHSHHALNMDVEGKDTQRYMTCGACATAMAASDGAAVIERGTRRLTDMLSRMRDVDLILVEGFEKEACLPAIEVWRDPAQPMRSLAQWRRAVVTQEDCVCGLPVFSPQETEKIADFILSLVQEQMKAVDAHISVQINGQDVSLVPFVQKLIENVNRGLMGTLDGYSDGCSMIIRIGKKDAE